MADQSSFNFLPEIFQTPINKQLLKATLDQMTQEPNVKITEGYIGHRYGAGVLITDRYVTEPDPARSYYQLEPGVIFTDPKTTTANDALTYLGYLDAISLQRGTNNSYSAAYDDPTAYFEEQFYSWNPFVDLDKMVNYTQYYWLPSGPDTITITATTILDIDRDIIGQKNYTTPGNDPDSDVNITPIVKFTNGLKIKFEGNVVPARYKDKEYVVEQVGVGIQLVEWSTLEVPDVPAGLQVTIPYDYYPYDTEPFNGSTGGNNQIDYVTISRASRDLNPWARQNRWFHVNVVRETARILGTAVILNDQFRGQRPILEFVPDLKLFNYGTEAINKIGVLDNTTTNAFLEVAGQESYTFDGIDFFEGMTVIFSADLNPEVSSKVYRVEFINPDSSNPGYKIINLIPTGQTVKQDSTIVCLFGVTRQGLNFWYNNGIWIQGQLKIRSNQAPLFDLFDQNGVSFSDPYVYPSNTFLGNPLFTYLVNPAGVPDSVLRFALTYKQLGDIGDITFDFNLYTDTFTYVNNTQTVTVECRTGFVRQYTSRTTYELKIGYDTVLWNLRQSQVFTYNFSQPATTITLDVPAVEANSTAQNVVQISIDSQYLPQNQYDYSVDAANNTTTINFITPIQANSVVSMFVISDTVSKTGWWEIPENLEVNPLNGDVTTITLNSVGSHYNSACRNIDGFEGDIIGPNNSRDLGPLPPYATAIIQHSAAVPISGLFLRDKSLSLFDSIDFNAREYEKFKQLMLEAAYNNEFLNPNIPKVLDDIINIIKSGKVPTNPFYWTDTLPSSAQYQSSTYTWFEGQTKTFDTIQTYDFDAANYKAILVYLNGNQLTRDIDYQVGVGVATVTVNALTTSGDQVEIREYATTYGTFVPATPTKLGLYPRYVPKIYLDSTFQVPAYVIQGHDGSITPAFGDVDPITGQLEFDIRDAVLLEYELRVYNNIKVNKEIPLVTADFIPGGFRTTPYTLTETQDIENYSFLQWSGQNRIDYNIQNYLESDQFTWNYRNVTTKLDQTDVPGFWRGLYEYYYDTAYPHIRPWEMLGFSEEPVWWQAEYGPAPYTSGNLYMWWDLRDGYIRGEDRYVAKYARPGLLEILPVDPEGNLLSPFDSIVKGYDYTKFVNNWQLGDVAPAENAWKTSSTYPFVIQKLMATLKPAKYFTYNIDRDFYRYDPVLNQWLYKGRNKLTNTEVEVYGNGTIKNSYINFIVEYNKIYGIDSTDAIKTKLDNIDVRLTYRVAAYTDKRYLQLIVDKSTPLSNNRSLLVPDESYQILLYRNEIFGQIPYSAASFLITDRGWQVYGNSTNKPYFTVSKPVVTGRYQSHIINGKTYLFPLDFQGTEGIPYGYTFTTMEQVIDFICGYGHALKTAGVINQQQENFVILDWPQMAEEFVYWTDQNWGVNTLYQLNPSAQLFEFERPRAVVVSLTESKLEDILVNQNRNPLMPSDYNINRDVNKFTLTALSENNLGFLNLKLTSYEHIIILDNLTIFNDVIYEPFTGLRQDRILFKGIKSGNWNGTLDAPGFIINLNNVKEWNNNTKYSKGDVVKYKNLYYQAQGTISPSTTFNYDVWINIDYNASQIGLLPNLATKAVEMTNFYNQFVRNLDGDADLLGYGITGFRPREYMSSIDLGLVSQINVYNDFIRTKGTANALGYFKGAIIDNSSLDYTIYENWAIQRAVYGSTATNAYVDLVLDETKLYANPSTVQIVSNSQISIADQAITVSDIYDSSTFIAGPNVLPLLTYTDPYTGLPSAGYVNAKDVDFQLFDIDLYENINSVIDQVTDDSTIWVAKVNAIDWAVYKCQGVGASLVSVTTNLSGQCLLTFDQSHYLEVDDRIIIREANTEIDGAYQVVYVPSPTTLIINLSLSSSTITTVYVTAIVLVLKNVRVAEPAEIANLPFIRKLEPGNKIWVDNSGDDKWEVLERQRFHANSTPFTSALTGTIQLGSGVGIGSTFTIYGAPGFVNGYGLQSGLAYINEIALPAPVFVTDGTIIGAGNFGTTVAVADGNYFAISAPTTVTTGITNQKQGYVQIYRYRNGTATPWQLIVEPQRTGRGQPFSGTYGGAMVFSEDENFLVISDTQYWADIYRLIPFQEQSVTVTVEQYQTTFYWGSNVMIDHEGQLEVKVNGTVLSIDQYTVNLISKTMTYTAARVSDTIVMSKRTTYDFVVDSNAMIEGVDDFLLFEIVRNNTQIVNTDVLSVKTNGSSLRYGSDYELEQQPDLSWNLDFSLNPAAFIGKTITVETGAYYVITTSAPTNFTTPTPYLPDSGTFGSSLSIDRIGRYLTIGDPGQKITGTEIADGKAWILNRPIESWIIDTPQDLNSWTTGTGKHVYPQNSSDLVYAYVSVNGIAQTRENLPYSTGTFTWNRTTGNIKFIDNTIKLGDIITISYDNFSINPATQILTNIDKTDKGSVVPTARSKFGASAAQDRYSQQLLIGSPDNDIRYTLSGSVAHFVNLSTTYGYAVTQPITGDVEVLANSSMYINDYIVKFNTRCNTAAQVSTAINTSYPANVNVIATPNADNTVTIATKNLQAVTKPDILTVTQRNEESDETDKDAFAALGIKTFLPVQTLVSGWPINNGRFGTRLAMNATGERVLISSLLGSAVISTTFDEDTTTFDARTTEFDDGTPSSGSVEYFNKFNAANGSIDNPDLYGLIGQFSDRFIKTYDYYGQGIAINRLGTQVLVGSPGYSSNHGRVVNFPTVSTGFRLLRKETDGVDVRLINEVNIYKKSTKQNLIWLDFIDPLQGKILGAAQQNIDSTGTIDPAQYNVNGVNNYGLVWQVEQVGQIWWNTSNARFINYHQDDINDNAMLWGTLFPGSTIDIYQWIESSSPPLVYTGPGVPYDYNSYTVYSGVDATGKVVTKYYFWVTGLDIINVYAGKTLSTNTIASYIANPNLAGIPYMAAINPSTVALFGVKNTVVAEEDVLHIDYDLQPQDGDIYAEFDLIKENSATDFLNAGLYAKMVDSYSGQNSLGQPVPDPNLKLGTRTGVQFRPRQSFFSDRLTALKNYITWANAILLQYAISNIRSPLALFFLAEPAPAAGSTDSTGQLWWNLQLGTYTELGYQDLYSVPLGYRYLIDVDSTERNNWSIYQVELAANGTRTTVLIRTQSYNTTDYWHYENWYAVGYDRLTTPIATVAIYADLSTITNPIPNSVVRVTNGSNLGYELYQYTNNTWTIVGIENGTIQIDSTIYDFASLVAAGAPVPYTETRNIIAGLNQEIFTDELQIFKNEGLIVTFKYIISEQINCNWLMKTSLIDVAHPVGSLRQYPTYKRDNQEFVQSYISEVKPYHTQIKDFNLIYATSLEDYTGDITDFDLPAIYNEDQQRYVSPIMNFDYSNRANIPNFGSSSYYANNSVWLTQPYRNWYTFYGISVANVVVTNSGQGYNQVPTVTFTESDALEVFVRPRLQAVLDESGSISAINVIDPGFIEQYGVYANENIPGKNIPVEDIPGPAPYWAQVVISEAGEDISATATVNFKPAYNRGFDMSVKYDRINLAPSYTEWIPDFVYAEGSLVRFSKRIWTRNSYNPSQSEGEEFNFNYWTYVPAGSNLIDGTDRTYAYYDGDPIYAMTGLVYPGVRLRRGFSGTYDTTPFSTDPYESDYSSLDTLLTGGVFPANGNTQLQSYIDSTFVQVEGGGFVDTYSSRAPEELVPGATFDVLDMTVDTTVGQDVSRFSNPTGLSDGWGSQVNSLTYNLSSGLNDIDYGSLLKYVHALVVTNLTTGKRLIQGINYSVNYLGQTITITSGYIDATSDNIVITAYSIGGGLQLYRTEYMSNSQPGDTIYVPVPVDPVTPYYGTSNPALLSNVVVLANMMPLTVASITIDTRDPAHSSNVRLTTNIPAGSRIDIVAFGTDSNPYYSYGNIGGGDYTWSLPQVSILTGNLANYTIANYNPYPNDSNLYSTIVEVDGIRSRGTASKTYEVTGDTVTFFAPYQADVDFSTLTAAQVNLWVNGSNVYARQNIITGGTDLVPFSYTTNYDARQDELVVTLAQAPSLANVNVQVTLSVTSSNAAYTISGDTLRFASGTSGTITTTGWRDGRQQQFDNRVYFGKSYDIAANSPNNTTTAATWSAGSRTLQLGFKTTGFWFGNTVYSNISNTGNLANSTGNVLINGIPYDFTGFGSIPFSLGNIVIVNSIDVNELDTVPINRGDNVYVGGNVTSSAMVQQRVVSQAVYANGNVDVTTITLPNVIPFTNFIGQRQYAVLLDNALSDVLGGASERWTMKVSDSTANLTAVKYFDRTKNPSGVYAIFAVGEQGTVIYSANADISSPTITNVWMSANVVNSNSSVRLNDLDSSPGALVTVGDLGRVFTANMLSAPSSWSSTTPFTTANLYGVTYIGSITSVTNAYNNQFVVVGQNGAIFKSANSTAVAWTNESISAPTLRKLAYADFGTPAYVVVGDQGTIRYKRGDDSTWSSSLSPVGALNYYDVYGSLGQPFIAVGQNGAIVRSTDGQVWTRVAGPANQSFIGNGSRTFVTTGLYVTNSTPLANQVSVVVDGNILVNGQSYSVDSLDPLTVTIGGRSNVEFGWTTSAPAPGSNVVISATPGTLRSVDYNYATNQFVASGDNGLVMVSEDGGNTWAQNLSFTSANINGINYASGPNVLIAVGGNIPTVSTYQKANATTTYQSLVMTSANLSDVLFEFAPNLANMKIDQSVTGDYILKETQIRIAPDTRNRTIDIKNPLNKAQPTAQENIVVRIRDVELSQKYDVGGKTANPEKLWVTLDGLRLTYGDGFTISSDDRVEILDPVANTSVIQILTSTNQEIPNELDFKLFKDMRDNPFVYRILPNTATTLASNLTLTGDVIYLTDSSVLQTPNVNSFGYCFVGSELVAYRYKDKIPTDITYYANGFVNTYSFANTNNCISGLVRGLGGTPWLSDYYSNTINIISNQPNLIPGYNEDGIIAWTNTYSVGTANIGNLNQSINRIAHTTGQAVVDANPTNVIPVEYRDRLDIATNQAITGAIISASRTNDVASLTVEFKGQGASVSVFNRNDLLTIRSSNATFNANAVAISNISVQPDPVRNLTSIRFNYANPGANTESILMTGLAGKVNYINRFLRVPSPADVIVGVAGNILVNPRCQFSTAGANVMDTIVANTANIVGGATLTTTDPTRIYVTVDGANVLATSNYTVSNVNPVIVTFNANSLSENANVIIFAENFYRTTNITGPTNIILETVPDNKQFVVVGADVSYEWQPDNLIPLQSANTLAARFFKGDAF